MSLEDLINRFINEPDRITPNQCAALLELLNFKQRKKRGSESVFHKKGHHAINVPTPKKGKYVKSPYIKRIIKLLELENFIEEGERNKAD